MALYPALEDAEDVVQDAVHRAVRARGDYDDRRPLGAWVLHYRSQRNAMTQVHIEIAEVLRPDQRGRRHDWLMPGRERSRRGSTQNPHER